MPPRPRGIVHTHGAAIRSTRLKDNELIAALIHYQLVDVETVRVRIAAVADLHMRAILLARLQIVLENVD